MINERAKQPAPELIVEFDWATDMRPHMPGGAVTNRKAFSVHNCGNAEARDVKVHQIQGASKIALFEVIARIGTAEKKSVKPTISAMDCATSVPAGLSRDFEFFVETDLCPTTTKTIEADADLIHKQFSVIS